MKTLRYLLIVIAAMAVLSVSAQSLAQQPQAEFHSTSSMVTSGSTLPQAAQSGVYTTYDAGLGSRSNKPGIRRLGEDEGVGGDGEGNTDPTPTEPGEPFPIGEGMWALLFCAAIFGGVIAFRRKRQQRNDRMMK